MKRRILLLSIAACMAASLTAQESIHSDEDLRYDFLALVGEAERPYLNHKTLSDANWNGMEGLRIYGPELYTSYNSASPYGMNDGALWQGKGLNASLTGGTHYASNGLELTFKPQLTYSRNQDFAILDSAYPSEYGYIWGYSFGVGADAPQRFGDEALYGYSWGDSEIRYTWKKATIGFGTQSPWVGPGRVNSIMHSNNAPPYPKADIGIRKTPLTIFGRYIGDVEARLWAGYLSESDYFDDDSSNDHNLISALSLAYAPSFLPGLTLMANRSYLAPWKAESAGSLTSLFFVNFWGVGDEDAWDQRAAVGFDYLFPAVGFEVYGEAGINDYARSVSGYIRYPFHTMVFTGGLRKSVALPSSFGARGELLFEWSNLEVSQNFRFSYDESFYMHYQIAQGYTNGGQWLGAGIGTGGNSQYLAFRAYHESYFAEAYLHRYNPDNDAIFQSAIVDDSVPSRNELDIKAVLAVGTRVNYKVSRSLTLSGGAAWIHIQNPEYLAENKPHVTSANGLRLEAGCAWHF